MLSGTYRADRKAPAPPKPIQIPRPPEDLNVWQRLAWVDLAKRANPLKITTESDLIAFRHMAIVLGILEQARKALDDAGSLTYEVTSQSGGTRVIPRPEVDVIAKYEKILDSKLVRFGLLPAEPEKAGAPAGDAEAEADPLDMFVTGSSTSATEDVN